MTATPDTTDRPAVTTDLAPLVESYTADGLAFAAATRREQTTRVRWAKRTRDEQERRRLRRG